MAPKVLVVNTLSAFSKQIENLLKKTKSGSPSAPSAANWYRGHSCSLNYTLQPYLYRHKTVADPKELMKLEGAMMREFKRQGLLHSFQAASDEPADRMQLLFYMQHHGVPTRLLDWSSNPFIALYFALSDARRDSFGQCTEAAAVWVLDPYRWNSHALLELGWGQKGPAYTEDEQIRSYLPREIDPSQPMSRYPSPIAISGTTNTARMMAQRGKFTIFSDDTRPMEQMYDDGFPRDSLVKLEVEKDHVDQLLSVLISIGYTDSVAYPDLQGLAMEIKRSHGFGA